jgi:platelet-activating factor acetylhydrolase
MAEISEAYYAMELINNGEGELILKNNLRKKGNVGSSSKGLENVDWSDWIGRLHMNNVTMMGHSFGGATTVQIARENDRYPWVGQGILLDAWGPAVPQVQDMTSCIMKPLLAIGSEAFMHWPENFDAVSNICKETRNAGVPCWMMTVKGSTHLSQTDFAVLYSRWMSWFAKNVINPRRAILLTVNPSLEFLKKVLPKEQTFGNSWIDEHVLDTQSLSLKDSLPGDHKPEEKWIAARLRIPNEFRLRIMSWFQRTPKTKVPTDASGKPLAGIITRQLGDEVWMHVSPKEEDMGRPEMPSRRLSRSSSAFSEQCIVV